MRKVFLLLLVFMYVYINVRAQGLHFSQIPQSPLLLNPSNSGLLPYDNYRAGVQYRNQWNTVPVDYTTIGAWGDAQIFRNKFENSWLGVGGAFYNDKAGDGILSLNQFQLSLAYHLLLTPTSMFSGGFYSSYNQRAVNFNNLTYDLQWNGTNFDKSWSSQESYKYESTAYLDLGLGLNYAIFPNENLYAKFGAGLMHLNMPKESFYADDNKIGVRPTLDVEIISKVSNRVIISPVLFASMQKKSTEFMLGSMFAYNVGSGFSNPAIFSIGAFYRLNDAFITALGYEFSKVKFLISYDITTSKMSLANQMNGAFELSIIYQGLYSKNNARNTGGYNCPRF